MEGTFISSKPHSDTIVIGVDDDCVLSMFKEKIERAVRSNGSTSTSVVWINGLGSSTFLKKCLFCQLLSFYQFCQFWAFFFHLLGTISNDLTYDTFIDYSIECYVAKETEFLNLPPADFTAMCRVISEKTFFAPRNMLALLKFLGISNLTIYHIYYLKK